VLIADTNREGAAQLAGDLGGAAREHDVTREDAWAEIADWAGPIDVLVNNAGVLLVASLPETTLEDFRTVQEVNQVGVFLGMRTFAPLMSARGSGSIVNLSSIAGRMGTPYWGAPADPNQTPVSSAMRNLCLTAGLVFRPARWGARAARRRRRAAGG
jgi:3alpha(or 20beta)-hydroxysteroid dehydrogenase